MSEYHAEKWWGGRMLVDAAPNLMHDFLLYALKYLRGPEGPDIKPGYTYRMRVTLEEIPPDDPRALSGAER